MLFLLVWLGLAIGSIPIARSKNRDIGAWFVLTLIFGFFSFIVLIALTRLPSDEEIAAAAIPTKQCPACAETIKAAARKCRFCGIDLDPENVRRHTALPTS